MPELATRYPCPVCLGVMMETVRIGGARAPLEVDHCGRCGGVWFNAGEVERLRRQPAAALWARIGRQRPEPVTPCHDCHAPLSRQAGKCASCGRKNLIHCPVCDRLMQRYEVAGIHLDACRGCKGAWFDHAELNDIWKKHGARLAVPSRGRSRAGDAAMGVGDGAVDTLLHAPDVAVHAAIETARAASHLPDVIGAAPEATVNLLSAAAEAAGEVAGGIFEIIVAILEAILSGIDL